MRMSKATEEALSVIAHVAMADGMARDLKGMTDFGKFYRKNMSAKHRSILSGFEKLSKQAYVDLAKALKEEMEKPS